MIQLSLMHKLSFDGSAHRPSSNHVECPFATHHLKQPVYDHEQDFKKKQAYQVDSELDVWKWSEMIEQVVPVP